MKKFRPFRGCVLAGMVATLIPVAASGQIMLSPAAVVGTDLGTFSPDSPLENMIDQSGVEKPFVSGTTSFDTYFAVPSQTFATNGPDHNWTSDTVFTMPVTGYVDFDLGASKRVGTLGIWNITLKDVAVSFAEDVAGLTSAPSAGSFVLTNHASFSFSYPVDLLVFGTPQQGRYMRLAVSSAYLLFPGFTFTYAVVGEVVASVAPPAPPAIAIAVQPTGDVLVTFTGTLRTALTLEGRFADVPGNPQGTYTVPKASLASQQFFRAVSN
jgi:hypothetical protein